MHPASLRLANAFRGLLKHGTMPVSIRGLHHVARAVVACLILVVTATAAAASIVKYTVTSVTRSQLAVLPHEHWAQYQTICGSPNATQTWTDTSLMRFFFPPLSRAGTSAAFYAWNGISWYVSDMGFLSPTPYGMCKSFCQKRIYATLQGNYAFSDNVSLLHDGGGDWPMISFYAAPFAFSGGSPSQVSIVTQDTIADGAVRSAAGEHTPDSSESIRNSGFDGGYTTLEYCNVPILGATGSAQTQLTAQVVVYANGTIIMRYASLPRTSTLPKYMPSTGLIYSKTLRTVVPTPTTANGIVAYRFDPVFDGCAAHGDASVCTADTESDCVWCSSTSACCASTVASAVCPRGQWTAPASSTAAFAPQKFYDVTVDFDTPFVSMSSYNYSYTLEHGYFPLHLEHFERNIPLFQTPSQSIMKCIPGASCPTQADTHPCGLYHSMCMNGNYTLSILALESSLRFAKGGLWTVKALPERARGEQLCEEEGGCATGLVGQLTGAAVDSYSSTPLFSVQLYADANGVIDITIDCVRCAQGDPMLTYPPMRVGLVRYGVDDASSVMIPQGLLRSGLHVRFVPRSSCKDCGLNGWCDESSGTCQCQPGYHGRSCVACPACWTGSECDDGINGSGSCLCNGGACEAACVNASSGSVPPRSCAGCDAVGGRCNCGVCECRDGWSGAGCSKAPADACRAYSLDGCKVCGQHEGCVFCHDSTCFNPALSGTRDGYTCSHSTPAADTQACVTYGSLGLHPPLYKGFDFIAIICLAFAAPVVFSLLVLVVAVRRNRRVPNPMDVFSVTGVPEFRNLQTEREVVQAAFTRKRVQEREMMGIPLKQISLRRLFKRRKEGLMNAQ
ncbi:conserved hypothetical protein [Leishmania major strain Friedlin]|uniref:EGF-like domain-containing protein n=1 Tax=Leishmania major TaxID=5664 RepID=Q4Q607_LEIMA|nr:conserved hypothetical protein [Leishmania major strain Friedlin]CAG9579433.1 hypothetical_protein_-_conserved [Leishmania major strain Friedlin]CAJ08455.1 conserved hypothetical protein [Leishmania major strain Friedlin]|eukprot:XP_001685241.1 conserved hypothetical protein [Leishmania major strain Friedlin]